MHHQLQTLDSPSVITFSTKRPRMLVPRSFIAQNAPTESCICTTRIPWYHQNPAYTHRILFPLTACIPQMCMSLWDGAQPRAIIFPACNEHAQCADSWSRQSRICLSHNRARLQLECPIPSSEPWGQADAGECGTGASKVARVALIVCHFRDANFHEVNSSPPALSGYSRFRTLLIEFQAHTV